MNRRPTHFVLATLLLLVLGEQLAAQAPDARAAGAPLFVENRFKKFDLDGDGKLTPEEAKPVAQLVAGADADGDGLLTLAEVQGHFAKQAQKLAKPAAQPASDALVGLIAPELEARFKQLDKDGDGKLAGEELAKARWLVRLDQNRDGGVTLEEAKGFFASFVTAEPPATSAAPPRYEPESSSPRQEPKVLRPADHGIGRMVPDVSLTDLDGRRRQLAEIAAGQALVIALTSPSCPIAKRYLPSLAALQREYSAKGIALLLIAPNATDTPEQLRASLREAAIDAPCAPDPSGTFSKSLGALASTDVFVLDAHRTLIYRGALDDQYGIGYSLEGPRHRYVAAALDAVLAGRAPAISATEAPGCVLDLSRSESPPMEGGITYHNRISRLLQAHCQECHRTGGVAPFALGTYEEVIAKAGMIRRMVERGLMPPWFAAPPEKGAHSPWLNDRSLPEADRAGLLAWLSSERARGDAKDAPLPRQWPAEWAIGQPDAVYQIPNPIEVKATGVMAYQNVFVETGLTEDKWVRALQVLPTSREVVHHVLVFARNREAGQGSRRGEDDGVNGFFAAYVPGNDHVIYPDGFAKRLPAGARLQFQIHYTPNGTATRDQVKLGVSFLKQPPEHVVQTAGIAAIRLNIPAGAEHHPESASIPVPREVRLLGLFPHMHVRGKAFRYEVILPDGSARTLLEVPRYDFNWQLGYRFAAPPLIPAGSKVRATGWYDNSANNPANPDPKKNVRWGPQTYDEMMIGYVEYYLPGSAPNTTAAR